MKKTLRFFILIFAISLFSAAGALADDPSSGASDDSSSSVDSNSILDDIGLSNGSCGTGNLNTPCSTDLTNASTGIFSAIACQVMTAFNSGVIPLYCNLVSNTEYLTTVNAAMALYVLILGFSFLFGMVQATTGTLMIKLLKALIIYSLAVNADLYFNLIYNTVFQTTHNAVQILLSSDTGAGSDTGATNFFQYIDIGMHKILTAAYQSQGAPDSGQTYVKNGLKIIMMGFAIWQLGGDLIGGLFFTVIIGWILNYFSIMIRYLLAMLSMMFLLMLGPIFIPTLLFDKTRYLGETWYKMILCFILQIVLVVAFVLMIQGFYYDLYQMIENGIDSPTTMAANPDKVLDTFATNDIGAYKVVNHTNPLGSNSQDAEQYFSQVFCGAGDTPLSATTTTTNNSTPGSGNCDYHTELPLMIEKFIELLAIITLATFFIKSVPAIAALLVGEARFVLIMQAEDKAMGGKGTKADLFGQGKSAIK